MEWKWNNCCLLHIRLDLKLRSLQTCKSRNILKLFSDIWWNICSAVGNQMLCFHKQQSGKQNFFPHLVPQSWEIKALIVEYGIGDSTNHWSSGLQLNNRVQHIQMFYVRAYVYFDWIVKKNNKWKTASLVFCGFTEAYLMNVLYTASSWYLLHIIVICSTPTDMFWHFVNWIRWNKHIFDFKEEVTSSAIWNIYWSKQHCHSSGILTVWWWP